MMYERNFGTDWESLDRAEAIERAFALGVAAACGEPNRAEYDRIHETMETVYDRSIVELAFEEGRSKAVHLDDRGRQPETIWEELVDGDLVEPSGGGYGLDDHLPAAVSRVGLLERSGGLPGSLELPQLLRNDRDR